MWVLDYSPLVSLFSAVPPTIVTAAVPETLPCYLISRLLIEVSASRVLLNTHLTVNSAAVQLSLTRKRWSEGMKVSLADLLQEGMCFYVFLDCQRLSYLPTARVGVSKVQTNCGPEK